MIYIKKSFSILIFMAILLAGSACAVNKKKKCDTCPKWSRIELPETSQPKRI